MIAKIMKGSDFKGVVYYILNDEKVLNHRCGRLIFGK